MLFGGSLGCLMLITATLPTDPAKLDKDKPLEAAAIAYLSARTVVHELHELSKSRLYYTKGLTTYKKRPHLDIVIARCCLQVPRGDAVEILALPEVRNPFAAGTEDKAFSLIDAIALEPDGPELLKHLHRQSSLSFKIRKRLLPLEQEVLAYLAAF